MRNIYHPDYGLPHEWRVIALRDAAASGVKDAAQAHRLGVSTVYKWRKDMEPRETVLGRAGGAKAKGAKP